MSAEHAREPVPWKLLLALTLAAALLRAVGLNSGLWYDEIRTLLDSVHAPLLRIVTVFPGDNQHTLFSVLAHLSISAFGDHPWSLRLPSMILGALTVPALYLLAREFVGRTEGLLASLLLAVSYHHVWFSQSARGYAGLTLFAVLCSWLLLRGLRRNEPRDFVAYAICAALGVYTHVSMVFLIASHAICCIIPLGIPTTDRARLERWKLPLLGFVLAGVFSLLLYSPVLLAVQQTVVDKPAATKGATTRWAFLELIKGLQIGLGSVVAVAGGGVLFLAGLWSYFRQSRFLLGIFLLPGVLTIGAAVVLGRPVRPRFVVFLIGFGLLIVVRGAIEVARLVQRRPRIHGSVVTPLGVGLVLAIALLSAASLRTNYRYPKQDFAGAMRFVDDRAAPGEPVHTAGPATYPYTAYFNRDWPAVASLQALDAARARGRRVWMVYTLPSYIDREVMQAMATGCDIRETFRGTVGGGDVTVCALPPVSSVLPAGVSPAPLP